MRALVSRAIQYAYRELLPGFEAASGIAVDTVWSSTGAIVEQIASDAPFDLVIAGADTVDRFIADALKTCRDGASGDKGTVQRLQDAGCASPLPLAARCLLWHLPPPCSSSPCCVSLPDCTHPLSTTRPPRPPRLPALQTPAPQPSEPPSARCTCVRACSGA